MVGKKKIPAQGPVTAPVAKLMPYVAPQKRKVVGSMKGSVLKYERPFDPIDAEWDINNPGLRTRDARE